MSDDTLTTRQVNPISSDKTLKDIIDENNDQHAALEGLAKKHNFDSVELNELFSGLGFDHKFNREKAIGHTSSDYTDWQCFHVDNGFNIWKATRNDYLYDPRNQLRLDNQVIDFMGEAGAESSDTFDQVQIYSGATWTSHTAEASTDTGTPFAILQSSAETLWMGSSSVFSGATFGFFRGAAGLNLQYLYSQATGIASGTGRNSILDRDNTSQLRRDGSIFWDAPGDWASSNIEGNNLYWIGINSVSNPSIIPQVYYIKPATNVVDLLKLSQEEISNNTKKWCSFGSSLYVTLPNSGDSNYEGIQFLRSGSAAVTVQQYFVNKHKIESDYAASDYTPHSVQRREYISCQISGTLSLPYANMPVYLPNIADLHGYNVTRAWVTCRKVPHQNTNFTIFNQDSLSATSLVMTVASGSLRGSVTGSLNIPVDSAYGLFLHTTMNEIEQAYVQIELVPVLVS